MATVTIKELYDLLTVDDILANDYSIKAHDIDGNLNEVITSSNAISYMLRKYATRRYSILKGREVNNTEAQTDFNEAFRLWILNRQANIDKQYQALFDYDYNPIENYDRYETENTITKDNKIFDKETAHTGTDTETHTGTDTETHTGTDTTSYNNTTTNGGTDTNTKTGTDTLNHSISDDVTTTGKAGFNAPNTFTNSEKVTRDLGNERNTTQYDTVDRKTTDTQTVDTSTTGVEHGEKIANQHGESISNQYGEKITDSGTDTSNGNIDRTLRIHGNIGVTTASAMIKETVELYMLSLAEMLIDNFINDYTFYS